jgi:putative ABC transport system substrate-binding protein
MVLAPKGNGKEMHRLRAVARGHALLVITHDDSADEGWLNRPGENFSDRIVETCPNSFQEDILPIISVNTRNRLPHFYNFAGFQMHRSFLNIQKQMSFIRSSFIPVLFIALALGGCTESAKAPNGKHVPVVGFAQTIEDATIDEARTGFIDALKEAGYSEGTGTVKIIYRNAQGDIPALSQIIDYFISEHVDLIAANTTLAMITAASKTSTIPIFMMVAPSPEIAKLTKADASGRQVAPANLSGTYETLAYIDTSVSLIRQLFPSARRVGTIYNSSEPNSVNSMERLRQMCRRLGLELVEASVTSSNETQQVMSSLLARGIDVFFALPDNIIFSSFETVYKAASDRKIPIVTSEAGLVKRGAFVAYGADFYQWGHQAGAAAAKYLKSGDLKESPLELVAVRKRTYNPEAAKALGLNPPAGFEPLK